jgi:hypothetical protein
VIPLTFALNSLNRTMGREDLYPFIVSPPVIEKLGFIHDLVHHAEQRTRSVNRDRFPRLLATVG